MNFTPSKLGGLEARSFKQKKQRQAFEMVIEIHQWKRIFMEESYCEYLWKHSYRLGNTPPNGIARGKPWFGIAKNISFSPNYLFQSEEWKENPFFEGYWIGSSSLEETFPDLYNISMKKASEADCWNSDNNENDWDLGFRRGILDREFYSWLGMASKIDVVTLRLGDGLDRAVWALDSSGIFSTKPAFLKRQKQPKN